jgi:glycosyltransferase involved in cell wall biosynthesis
MKILYIGNYRDGTGWGEACLNNILGLNYHADVVCRPISFNGGNAEVPPIINELEGKSTKGCDIVIQHTLPDYYVYKGGLKNVCIYEPDTTFRDTMWHKNINTMDLALLPSMDAIELSKLSGVKTRMAMCPHSFPFARTKNYNTASVKELENTFNFGFVGEFIARKNVISLLKAFHTEFHPSEPVNLFLKLGRSGSSSDQVLQEFQHMSRSVKAGLKLRDRYKEEIVITGHLEKTALLSIMSQCHAFVMPSHGEAWCYPALESMALSIPVLKTAGMMDYTIGSDFCSTTGPCFAATDSLPNIYTGLSTWRNPDIKSIMEEMRWIYNMYTYDQDAYLDLRDECRRAASEYDNEIVGKTMVEELLCLL